MKQDVQDKKREGSGLFPQILALIGSGFAGLNLGMVSGFNPAFLLLAFAFSRDSSGMLSAPAMEISYAVCAVAALLTVYLYRYRQKRSHDSSSSYLTTFLISLGVGALLMLIVCFIVLGSKEEGIISYWG